MAAIATRLPGITFETRTPPIPAALPRMDIAGFAGFAASGPVNLPVAVEDARRFHDLFGEDVDLGRDPESGEVIYGELAPTARTFFRDGGVRCWIVRIADGRTAITNRFPIPGLLAGSSPTGTPDAAVAFARSPGSWSDALAVNATITLRRARVPSGSPPAAGFAIDGLVAGDLIQADYPSVGITSFQPVRPPSPSTAKPHGPLTAIVPSAAAFWFQAAIPADLGAPLSSAPETLTWFPDPVRVVWLTGVAPADDTAAVVNPELPGARWGAQGDRFVIEIGDAAAVAVQNGSWLRIDLVAAPRPSVYPFLLLQVDRSHSTSSVATSPVSNVIRLSSARAWWLLDPPQALPIVDGLEPRVGVAEVELWVRDPGRGITRVPALGCVPGHARYWGDVPSDRDAFADPAAADPASRPSTPFRASLMSPRFPLCAPPRDPSSDIPVFLPLGVSALADDEWYQPSVEHPGTRAARDGLQAFTSDLFLDAALWNTPAARLLADAFQIQYVETPQRALTGVHAFLPIDEISMLACPDAALRRWTEDTSSISALGAPTLLSVTETDGTVRAEWTAVPRAASYILQTSADPRFATIAREWAVDAVAFSHPIDTKVCPAAAFYRVRAVADAEASGPWSNTRWIVLPTMAFDRCPDPQPPAPDLLPVVDERGHLLIAWSDSSAGVVAYTLESSADPAFPAPLAAYTGPAKSFDVLKGPDAIVYFRVAAVVDGRPSAWSVTQASGTVLSVSRLIEPVDDYEDAALFRIQKALVRLCAARGDVHAVLSLPIHFREEPAIDYVSRLAASLELDDDARTPSFASVFHPWVIVRETTGRADRATWAVVPDGVVCGTIAARTIRGGAWLSPANQALLGVLSLQPWLDGAALRMLQGRVNPLAQQPAGFVAIDAVTLSRLPEIRDLHVRRLLILLRRLATREGTTFVFANNDDSLRRLVQREFERVLGDLFVRGAFAGDTHDEGYRVVTDPSVNPLQSVEQGRLIVELQVAPSQPLAFLTVRLIQAGGAILAVEEG